MLNISLSVAAYLMDLVIGDPYHWPHPVKIMGHYINWFLTKSDYQHKNNAEQRKLGAKLVISLIVLCLGGLWLLMTLLSMISPYLSWVLSLYIMYTCFSVKGLADEAQKVLHALKSQGLEAGRRQVAMIVGRDTSLLTEEEITKAVIETVAENTSDGFIAPLCYILLFGPYGGIAYKVINTLDSMIGYKQHPYTHIGFYAAKLDDIFNWIPARMTWLFLWLAAYILKFDWKQAWHIGLRDRLNHSSPNSGFPEAVAAGALGIQLGGTHEYHKKVVVKPTIGDARRPAVRDDIESIIQLLYSSSLIGITVLSVIRLLFGLVI